MGDRVLPYGTWPSPLTAAAAVAGAPRFGGLAIDRGVVRWTESRPSEGGRSALVEWRDGTARDVAPSVNARSRVNEYGGGGFWAGAGALVVVDDADGRIHRVVRDDLLALVPEPPAPRAWRYAAGAVGPGAMWTVCERELHVEVDGTPLDEPVNDLCVVALDGSGTVRRLVGPDDTGGGDFVAAPALSPDGTRLAWLRWDHPDMPWDAAEVWVAELVRDDGLVAVSGARRVAGGRTEGVAACLPRFGPDGTLWWCDDRTLPDGTDLWRLRNEVGEVLDVPGEVGEPRWVSGGSRYGFLPDGTVVAAAEHDGMHTVWCGVPGGGAMTAVEGIAYVELLVVDGGTVAVVGGGPDRGTSVLLVDPSDGSVRDLRPTAPLLDAADVSVPRFVTFPTAPTPADRTEEPVAHALYYPPRLDGVVGPADAAPPLVVRIHGGPTASVRAELSASVQFWTTRGFAVVDVDYRGSTGHGRAYREALRGQWGVADVADCLAAAAYLAGAGLVDGGRCVIRGGSAGGFTALSALLAGDVMAGACVLYAVTDLLTLDDGTHKFESRYNDGLVGPRPAADEVFRERSPLTHVGRIRVPVLVMQGTEDLVVPQEQAERLVRELRRTGALHDYLVFEGEGHGFRRAETLVAALDAELRCYTEVLGLG